MKLLQLNIETGKNLEKIAEFILNNNYDIVCMQELTSDERFQGNHRVQIAIDTEKYPTRDCFKELQRRLVGYQGDIVKVFQDKNNKNYLGNAIFYKSNLNVLHTEIIRMNEERAVSFDELEPLNYPYAALSLQFEYENNIFNVVTSHLTWSLSPEDDEIKISRSSILLEYLKKLNKLFIFAGDFNVHPNTKTAMQFEDISISLVKKYNITNTLNPNLHRAKHIFPSGIACDQIFVSSEVKVKNFQLITEDLSDHYGLELEFDLR